MHALQTRGFSRIAIVNRTLSRAEELASHFGEGVSAHGWDAAQALVKDAGLIVNTTSLGMSGHGEPTEFPLDLSEAQKSAVATDIVYIPLKTPFLASAEAAGLKTVDGLGMLLHQAVPGFERWFGKRPEVTEALRNYILDDMKRLVLYDHPRTDRLYRYGKTTAANMFADNGVPVYSADDAVHQLYSGRAAPDRSRLPGTVVDGTVDRTKLSSAVLGKPEALKSSNPSFIHSCTKRKPLFLHALVLMAPISR